MCYVLGCGRDEFNVRYGNPATVVGVDLLSVEPMPSWPCLFAPQHFAVPSDVIAQVWVAPEDICVKLTLPASTCPGSSALPDVLCPSRPDSCEPQHSAPVDVRAHAWLSPFETADILAALGTFTRVGTLYLVVEPIPS